MRGVLYLGNKESTVKEFPDPTPGPGQVLVEIKAAGICGSDVHVFRMDRDVLLPTPEVG